MKHVEDHFKGCERYELFTGHKARRTYICTKAGYRIFSREKVTRTWSLCTLRNMAMGVAPLMILSAKRFLKDWEIWRSIL